MSEPIIATTSLTKKFGDFFALSDVTLQFAPRQIHAILGENGAGKSTLLKILFGMQAPTSGEIFIRNKTVHFKSAMDAIQLGLGMVQQHFSLVGTLSAIDNIMLGAEISSSLGHLRRDLAIAQMESLLPTQKLAVPWNEKVSQFSVGLKQRLEILKLLYRKTEILFLDEPTAVLTPQEVQDFFQILRELRNQGKTIFIITHKVTEVFELCDTYCVLRQGKMVKQGIINEATPQILIESMLGSTPAPLTQQRAAVQKEKLVQVTNVSEKKNLNLLGAISKNKGMPQSNDQGRGQLRNISLDVHRGEIVGIAGVEGAGQGHLVETLMGLRPYSGRIDFLGLESVFKKTNILRNLGVGLIPEDRHRQGIWEETSCIENAAIGLEHKFDTFGILDPQKMNKDVHEWAKVFDVRSADLIQSMKSLSGGNQQKLVFAREVAGRRPKFLICHQPTRGIDLGATIAIQKELLKLRDTGLGILLLSSDLDELMHLSDRIYVFFEGRVQAEFSKEQFQRVAIGAAMTGSGVTP